MLEELEHAQKRKAKVYAELLGTNLLRRRAHQRARPDRRTHGRASDGVRGRRHQSEEVDYINAHGTSTPIGERARRA